VKRCRVSPDGYVQMAMQLAYYRDQGRFDATYEVRDSG
jgi:carnitine O-palmitoyltransferase 1